MSPDLRDRIRGSLLLGAVGDALGAPVEFWDVGQIRSRCGPAGVVDYLPAYGRDAGAITDDTQMTLFTAEGLIRYLIRGRHRGIASAPGMFHEAYLVWLSTQGVPPPPPHGVGGGWLRTVPGLHARRAPGNTCLTALASGRIGTIAEPINQSKGCGGVMRVGPVGLVGLRDTFLVSAQAAAVTHGHPSGYLSAGFLGELVAALLQGASLRDGLDHATARLVVEAGHEETLAAVQTASALARTHRPTPELLEMLGGAWVGEEALAIGVACALRADDPIDGVFLAVNHSGDSDSTGAIAGTILGVLHGATAIPETFVHRLELADVVTQVADDLFETGWGHGVGGAYEAADPQVDAFLERYRG
ncbi:MAG: ADP-ribosylglycohydrolase family protein [Phycicoccus sp.]|nr:ADP-ribosylglycohydrolase family protein [Phycicoccus sp.]